MYNLALSYQEAGQLQKALALFDALLAERVKQLGRGHSDVSKLEEQIGAIRLRQVSLTSGMLHPNENEETSEEGGSVAVAGRGVAVRDYYSVLASAGRCIWG